MKRTVLWLTAALCLGPWRALPWTLPQRPTPGDRMFAAYLERETGRLARRCLAGVKSAADWEARKKAWRRQLREMFGLVPEPPRTELRPVITGRLERDGVVVEKIHFQSLPGLYVTANLYLPAKLEAPAPAVLYACGHAKVVVDGKSCGNKAHYQHHGVWFARHGYVCLMIDTIQLGEIMGVHHGTYRLGMWWWNSRGYTPGGVEVWNCIRALDYLETRPEVDPKRIGMTGRSGGGAYTWFTTALDDRVRVAAPIAGITDLRNYVVDDAVEGHCDCMFFVNTYRWDYPQLAALAAPRPLLIGNTDKDTIFPLDGVLRTYWKVRGVYQLLGRLDRIGLAITEGPHHDSQELRVPVFRWFDRFLKGTNALVDEPARPLFKPLELRVFDELPKDQINTRIQELFIPQAEDKEPLDPEALQKLLLQKSFRAWSKTAPPPEARELGSAAAEGLELTVYEVKPQTGFALRAYLLRKADARPRRVTLQPMDQEQFVAFLDGPARPFARLLAEERRLVGLKTSPEAPSSDSAAASASLPEGDAAWLVFAPSGVGPTVLWDNAVYRRMMRRRLALLGQTLAGLQTWDIRQAVRLAARECESAGLPLVLRGRGPMANLCLLAGLFEAPRLAGMELEDLRLDEKQAPSCLNLTRVTNWPQILAAARKNCRTTLR